MIEAEIEIRLLKEFLMYFFKHEKGHFAELENIVQSVGTCQKFIFSATLTLTHKGSTRLKNAAPETSEEKLKKLMKTIGMLY